MFGMSLSRRDSTTSMTTGLSWKSLVFFSSSFLSSFSFAAASALDFSSLSFCGGGAARANPTATAPPGKGRYNWTSPIIAPYFIFWESRVHQRRWIRAFPFSQLCPSSRTRLLRTLFRSLGPKSAMTEFRVDHGLDWGYGKPGSWPFPGLAEGKCISGPELSPPAPTHADLRRRRRCEPGRGPRKESIERRSESKAGDMEAIAGQDQVESRELRDRHVFPAPRLEAADRGAPSPHPGAERSLMARAGSRSTVRQPP